MPGLFGVIPKNRGLAGHSLLEMGRRMADSMRHTPWLRAEIWGNEAFCGGRVHLGVHNPDPQPLASKDELVRAWFDGDYYATSTVTSSRTPTADEISELVRNPEGLARIDGIFNLACYDAKRQELVLANDRLGFRPLYYTETSDWFAYAGEVKALLAIRDRLPDLDEVSLRQFFGFDHMLGERTWWKGIELLPPASVWRISAEGRRIQQYWTFDNVRRDLREPAEVEEEFGRLWSQDVRRHSKPGTMPLLLSGGLDSRLLLAELLDQGADVVTITFGSEDSAEMKPARHIAVVAGVPHRAVHLGTANWWHRREEAIWQTDGLVNGDHHHYAVTMDEMHTGTGYSSMNIAGDLLFGGSQLDRDRFVNWRLSLDGILSTRYMFNPFFDREQVLAASIEDAQRYARGPSSDCFHIRQRLRRHALYAPVALSSHCEIAFPGMSHALLNLFLGALADEERVGRKFYKNFLVKRYPKFFANVRWQITGRGLAESPSTRIFRGIEWRLLRLVGREAVRLPTSYRWFVNYPECIRASKVREKLLNSELISDSFLGGRARHALAHPGDSQQNAGSLIAILTFETYLRQIAGMGGPSYLGSRSSTGDFPALIT